MAGKRSQLRTSIEDERKILRAVALGQPYREAKKGTSVTAITTVSNIVKRPENRRKLERMKLAIRERMEKRERLNDEALLDDLEAGLDASTIQGRTEQVLPDFSTRHKWWESAMELKGHIDTKKGPKDDLIESGPPAVNITILNANIQPSDIRTETTPGAGPYISIGE